MIKSLCNFIKVEHTIFSLPLLLAGAWIGNSGAMPAVSILLLICLAGVGARTVGMAINRIVDRDLDAMNPRTANRELVQGTITCRSAWLVVAVGLSLYLLACGLLGSPCLKLAIIPLIPLSCYSLLKRVTVLCHYGIGVCLAMGTLAAFVAASHGLEFDRQIMLLTLFTFCWISGFDIIYALQDIDSDRVTGVRSIPARLGSRMAQIIAAITHAVALCALISLALVIDIHPWAWSAVVVSAAAFVLAYLPSIPLAQRFFPLSAVAGISASVVPFFGRLS